MSIELRDQTRLRSELAELRAALRSVEPPPPDEAALRRAFRQAQRERAEFASAVQGSGSARLHIAAAAAVVLTLAAVLGAVALRVEAPVSSVAPELQSSGAPAPFVAPALQPSAPPSQSVTGAFQPLQNSPRFVPSASYSVVRVRIPLAAFAFVPGSEQGGTIEADLLVGEDGLARGIRFNPADAAIASANGNR